MVRSKTRLKGLPSVAKAPLGGWLRVFPHSAAYVCRQREQMLPRAANNAHWIKQVETGLRVYCMFGWKVGQSDFCRCPEVAQYCEAGKGVGDDLSIS